MAETDRITMTRTGTITMSMRELERIKIIAAVAERRLQVIQTAKRLALYEPPPGPIIAPAAHPRNC